MRVRFFGFATMVVGGAVLACACGAFVASTEEPSPADAGDASSDAATIMPDTSASPDAGALSDAGPTCVNLAPNPSFEDQAHCVPWTNYGADGTADDSTPTHSGAHACGACSSSTINLALFLDGHPFAAGESIHVELWVRASDGALVGVPAGLFVETTKTSSGDGVKVYLTKEYQPLRFDYTLPLDGGSAQIPGISVIVSRGDDAGVGCILLDDVTACRPDGG